MADQQVAPLPPPAHPQPSWPGGYRQTNKLTSMMVPLTPTSSRRRLGGQVAQMAPQKLLAEQREGAVPLEWALQWTRLLMEPLESGHQGREQSA